MRGVMAAASVLLVLSCQKYGIKASHEAVEVRNATGSFYSAVLPLMGHGVPGDIKVLRPWISADLAKFLEEASDAEGAYYERCKDDSPPMVEGDLFSSLSEGPTSFKVLAASKKDNGWACTVELRYQTPGSDEKPLIWNDRATLIPEGGRWVVDDLDLLSTHETASSGTLKSWLRKIIKDGNDPDYK